MWHNIFDKILLINLPERTDRLQQATEELNKHKIPFEIIEAIKKPNGAEGLFDTMFHVFNLAEVNEWNNILIFEDDVQIIGDINAVMNNVMYQMPYWWDLIYLGANVNAPLMKVPNCDHMLRCNSLLSTHALGYSKACRKEILEEMRKGIRRVKYAVEPIDQLLERVIQVHGRSYVTNPLLAVQRPSYSDILKMDIDWAPRIQDTFCKRIKEMKNGSI